MGLPIKVTDELAEAARKVAELANRSMTKQIEHWAQLGRAVEHLAPMSDLMALKMYQADPSDAEKTAKARDVLERLVVALADHGKRAAALKVIHNTGKPIYGAVPGRADRVLEVWPDGRRVMGRIVGQEFIADEPVTDP